MNFEKKGECSSTSVFSELKTVMEVLDFDCCNYEEHLAVWLFTRVSQNPAVSNRPEVGSRFLRNVGKFITYYRASPPPEAVIY